MERKKKEIMKEKSSNKENTTKNNTKNKDKTNEFDTKKQSTIFFVIIAIFVLLILIGILASKNLNKAYGVTTYRINFSGSTVFDFDKWGNYDVPAGSYCETDEYGYLDPECAYKFACICSAWSYYPCPDDNNCNQVQHEDLYSVDIFARRFDSNEKFYCYAGSSGGGCPQMPTESCYVCEGGNGPVKTYNKERAETITGGTNCQPVEDSKCSPSPSPSPSPTNKCYSCKLGEGKEYAYSTSKEEAASKTGGTECVPVSDTNCLARKKQLVKRVVQNVYLYQILIAIIHQRIATYVIPKKERNIQTQLLKKMLNKL